MNVQACNMEPFIFMADVVFRQYETYVIHDGGGRVVFAAAHEPSRTPAFNKP